MDQRFAKDEYREDPSPIGRCTFGCVFKFTHIATNTAIAVKRTRLDSRTSTAARDEEHFTAEFQGEQLKPFFVQLIARPVVERRKTGEELLLPMEFCQGGSLLQYVRSDALGRLTEQQIQRIVFFVATGLKHMHMRKVVHRDIKAENILLTSNDLSTADFKICDFGVARILNSEEKTDLKGMIGAPEMVTKEYDCRVDVWSLGVLTKDLAFGRDADFSSSRMIDLHSSLTDLYKPEVSPKCSVELNDFLEKTLQQNVKNRPYIEEVLKLPFLEGWKERQLEALLSVRGVPRISLLLRKTK